MRLTKLMLWGLLAGCTAGTELESKVPEETDRDGDGYTFADGDCDDDDAGVNPDAEEIWYDGNDQDCDGNDDDQDGDDYGDGAGDCDDENDNVSPIANEECDGIDNNCSGDIDEDLLIAAYPDDDDDGYGDDSGETEACADDLPRGYVVVGDDCDDSDDTINPDAADVCDGIDNNCDGDTDDDAPEALYADADGDGFGDAAVSVGGCDTTPGYVEDNTDCDDAAATTYPGAAELCDGVDNDCDGAIDGESSGTPWYSDADGDGHGDPATAVVACEAPEGLIADGTDCDDTNSELSPSAVEVCDTIDNNCDGVVDEGVTLISYLDLDADGYGDDTSTTEACEPPAGYALVSGDCDDSVATTNPGAPELCADLADNDCDGLTDADDPGLTDSTWYLDVDGDGYGDSVAPSVSDCAQPVGYVLDATDCDDADAAVSPAAVERCDGLDNNCDGLVDDASSEDAITAYGDIDGDGYGDGDLAETACEPDSSFVADDTDCDDADAAVNPGAVETCNEIDDDCDGEADEAGATGAAVWYRDADGDGEGSDAAVDTVEACSAPDGYAGNPEDCDDMDPTVYFGATEVCNGVDDNCDSVVDTDAVDLGTYYEDADGDGYGAGASSEGCPPGSDWVLDDGDCDDADELVSPGQPEIDDGLDQNCDGLVDDDFVDVGDLVVTEIYRQPRFGAISTNDDGQWFEIYNTSSRDIDLSNWTIARAGIASSAFDIDLFQVDPASTVVVPAASYAVFCFGDDFEGSVAAYPLSCDYFWGREGEANNASDVYWNNTFHLQRDEDSISLYLGTMEDGVVIDDVYWYYDSTNGEWPRDARFSLNLDPAAVDGELNDEIANWCGTAGATNDTSWAWYDNVGTSDDEDDEHGSPGADNYDCP